MDIVSTLPTYPEHRTLHCALRGRLGPRPQSSEFRATQMSTEASWALR